MRTFLKWILFLGFTLSTPIAAADKFTILVLGDSLSAGYGMDAAQSWPALLQQRLDQQQLNYTVVNVSVSGDTSRTALNRLPHALRTHQPAIVIVSLGGNDGLRGISLSEMQNSLHEIVITSQQHKARVLLAGVRLPPNYGKQYIEKFSEIYQQLSVETKSPLVPQLLANVAGNPELMQADGLHPTDKAQSQIVENIWPHLVPLLDTDRK